MNVGVLRSIFRIVHLQTVDHQRIYRKTICTNTLVDAKFTVIQHKFIGLSHLNRNK